MFWWRRRQEQLEFLAFGLGNPGMNYVRTRHNVGWWVLDELARQVGVTRAEARHRGQADICLLDDVPSALIKPTTFMNRSGQCVLPWLRQYPEARWVVVVDDLALPAGKLRLRQKGSSGGHKGLESIINALRTEEFNRLRLGVGEAPAAVDTADWLLTPPSPSEEDQLMAAVQRAVAVVQLLAADRFDEAQRLAAGPA